MEERLMLRGDALELGKLRSPFRECLKRAFFGHMVNNLSLLSPSNRAPGVVVRSFPSQRGGAGLPAHSSRA